ncbi:uncharacterized protein [Anabrus simplex]
MSLAGLITGSIGLLTSVVIQQPKPVIRAGIPVYCPILVGLCTSGTLPALYGLEINYQYWIYMIIGAIFSVYLTSALSSLFGSIGRYPLPCFAVPFVTVQMMLFLCVLHSPSYIPPLHVTEHNISSGFRMRRDLSAEISNHTFVDMEVLHNIDIADKVTAEEGQEDNVEVATVSPDSSKLALIAQRNPLPVDISQDRNVAYIDQGIPITESVPLVRNHSFTDLRASALGSVLQEKKYTHSDQGVLLPEDSVHDTYIIDGTSPDANEQTVVTSTEIYNASEVDVDLLETFYDPNHADWGQVFTGILLSMTQVFGACNAPAAALMYLGVLIFSPTTGLMCLLGATLSTLTGLLFCPPPYTDVYQGVWGFNGLLCAAAMSGFCFVLTPQSVALGLTCALFATCLQNVLNILFSAVPMPIMSVPFNISALLFACVTSAEVKSGLIHPDTFSFPERHRYDWLAKMKAEKQKDESPNEVPVRNEKEEEAEQQRKLTEEEV